MKFKPVLPLSYGSYDPNEMSDRFGSDSGVEEFPSKTVQSQRDDADINVIVKRFGIGGTMSPDQRPLMYGDFTGITDFASAFAAVADAQESFMQMPADVRTKFANDPQKFLEFCENPANREEMGKLGLLVPKAEEPKPQKVEIVNAELKATPPKVEITPGPKS